MKQRPDCRVGVKQLVVLRGRGLAIMNVYDGTGLVLVVEGRPSAQNLDRNQPSVQWLCGGRIRETYVEHKPAKGVDVAVLRLLRLIVTI